MDAGTVDAALATHLKLAEQLRTQLVELQKSLHKPVEEATPPPPATARTTDDRERLMSLARGLSDTEHLQQLCDLAEQLRAKETTAPPAPAPAPEAVVPRRLPAAALNKPASNLVSVQFGAQAGKLGISFEAPSSSDAPRIKAIAPDGAAAEFSDLKVGLVLATIQGQSVAGMKMKEAIAMIRSAGRPLTLEFNHSAQSVFNAASTARDGDYADDSDDSDDDQAFDDARDVEAPQPAPAAAAPTRLAVEFTEQGKLGMSFGSDTDDAVPPIKVTRVTAGGLAAKDSRMRPGLTIVRIAGEDCSSWPLKQVVGTIKASSRPLALEFLEDEAPAARSGLPDLTIPGDDDELLGAGVGLPARVEKIKVEKKEDLYSPSGGTRGGGVKILAKAGGEPPELGEYKLLANCKCYKEKELDAAPCDFGLDKGEIFEVQEVALVDDGVIRLRSADGWISYLHAITGGPMLVTAAEADAIEDAAAGAEEGEDAKAATTLVIFQKEGPLGMTFGSADPSGAPPVSISRMNRTGLAAQQPALRRGLVILSIQGDDVSNKPLKDVITGIKTARRPLTLEFEKDVEGLKSDELAAIAVLKQTKASGQEQHRMTMGMVDDAMTG